MSGKSLFEKVWEDHLVSAETPSNPAVLYIDLHLAHEVTTPQAFTLLREQGLPVRRPDLTLATLDHSTPTVPVGSLQDLDVLSEPAQAAQIRQMAKNCADFGIELHGFGSDQRGIVHVIGPEIGATQPGKTIVCGDSHSSTHGAFGALAFGIGSTEVGHVLATQCLLQRKPMSMAINFNGRLPYRALTGLYNKACGYQGSSPWAYQDYADNRLYDPDKPAHKVAYPDEFGRPIPTLAWEAHRAGIDDVRYLEALDRAIAAARKRLKQPDPSQDLSAAFDEALRVRKQDFESIDGRWFEYLCRIRPGDLEKTRRSLADVTVRLNQALGK